MYKNLIYKDNKMIEASYRLSLNEQRLVLLAISRINSLEKVTENDLFILTAAEYSSIYSMECKEAYREMKAALQDLSSRWIKVIDDGDDNLERPWLFEKGSTLSNQSISLRFHPYAAKLLSDLKGEFTKYRLLNVSGMKSVYAIRLYEMLMRWKVAKSVTLTVEELKERMQLFSTSYSAFGNIKLKVIAPAVLDINKCSDITVSYELIKKVRTVVAVKFIFSYKPGMEQKELARSETRETIKDIRAALK